MIIRTSNVFNNILIVFVIANIMLFFSMFFVVQANLYLALLLSVFILLNANIIINNLSQVKHILFVLFIIIELLSLLNLFFYPLSKEFIMKNPSMIFQGLSYLLIPQVFFYAAGSFIGTNKDRIIKNIDYLLSVNFVMLLIGLIFYIVRPDFFLDFQHKVLGDLFEFYNGHYPRLTSYLGNSMIIGIVSSLSFILTLEYIENAYKKYSFLIIFLVGTILSLQRGAWVSLSLGLIIYFLLNIKRSKVVIKGKLLFIISIIILLASAYIYNNADLGQLANRVDGLVNALTERMHTWNYAIIIIKDNVFGAGLGILSHKSASMGFSYAIPDANYFRILGELGVIGISLFLLLGYFSLYIAYKKKMYSIFSVLIIFYFQAIGTNVFDLFYCSFIFWLIIGIVYSQAK